MKEMSRENAREIHPKLGSSLDACAQQLLEYKARGESVFVNFNRHKIYSCDITSVDYAYQEVFGMTKEATERQDKEDEEKQKREKAERKAKSIEKAKADMPKWIEALKGIKKEELDERVFYEQVLSVIKGMRKATLTPELAKDLHSTLEEIGCMKYDDWKVAKEKNGEKIKDFVYEKGLKKAKIGMAVSFVSGLMEDSVDDVNLTLSAILNDGDEYSWVKEWLNNSQKISQFKSKNPIIGRIMTLVKRRNEIKKAINEERQKGDNIRSSAD